MSPDLGIRRATPADLANIQRIIDEAYTPYILRIGQRPAPLDDDYAQIITSGDCYVATAPDLAGLIVLRSKDDALMIENVAVSSAVRGRGVGGHLLRFAETRARAEGKAKITLYTHVLMSENQAIYAARGFHETHRAVENGLHRVFMTKPLA